MGTPDEVIKFAVQMFTAAIILLLVGFGVGMFTGWLIWS